MEAKGDEQRLLQLYQSKVDPGLIATIFNEHSNQNFDEAKGILEMIVADSQQKQPIEEQKEPQSFDHQSSLVANHHHPNYSINEDSYMNDEGNNDDLQSVIPEEEAPFVTVSEGLYREIFLMMRFQLNNDQVFIGNLELMMKILKNIVNEPTNKKFQRLRLSNERIKKAIGECDQSRFIIELLGFQKALLPPEQPQQESNVIQQLGQPDEEYYVLVEDRLDVREFEIVINVITTLLKTLPTLPPLAGSSSTDTSQPPKSQKGGPQPVPLNYKKQQQLDKIKNQDSTMKNRLAAAAEERKMRHEHMPELYQEQRQVSQHHQQLETYYDQLKFYRDSQRNKYRAQNQGKVITTADLQKKIDEDIKQRNNAQAGGKGDSERWGIRALDLTNQFRAENGLPALSWNQKLHDIAMTHCVNMAEGKVPVGHAGFNDRMKMVPFFVRSFAENVAYNYNAGDPVEVAVKGWIQSPGHRKNMLATNNLCGIAVYRYYGRFYFTQLFALT